MSDFSRQIPPGRQGGQALQGDIGPDAPLTTIRKPYLVFLGDVKVPAFAKTAFGVRDWLPEETIGQWRAPGCTIDLGVPELRPADAYGAGARSLLIGVASAGGQIPPEWESALIEAVEAGLDIVSGLHTRLGSLPGLAAAAERHRRTLHDVRHSNRAFPVGSGRKRTGKRLLTVGTDCALGKKYTALAIARAMAARGVMADFRATGQTGIMISGSGVAIDAVVADFVSGAAEALSPDAADNHWDVIEGQGSLFHPAYAGVALGLLHGSQPDALVLCHDPTRTHLNMFPDFAIPALGTAIERYLDCARLTNPAVRMAGISLNTSELEETRAREVLKVVQQETGLPTIDPIRTGCDVLIDGILVAPC